ncbi:MAG: DUF2513 domain-containing protein [Pirellulales bacterium]
MKRDVDLARQLLFDLEAQGADCSLGALRTGLAHDAEERVRYHVRLLIDAGLVKEIDRTTAATPCVRLTNAGHEFIELARSEGRWRKATWVVQQHTGGASLTVLRALLTKWAVQAVASARGYRPRRRRSDPYRVNYYRAAAHQAYDDPRAFAAYDEYDPRRLRERPDYREQFDWPERFERDFAHENGNVGEPTVGLSLPIQMV